MLLEFSTFRLWKRLILYSSRRPLPGDFRKNTVATTITSSHLPPPPGHTQACPVCAVWQRLLEQAGLSSVTRPRAPLPEATLPFPVTP